MATSEAQEQPEMTLSQLMMAFFLPHGMSMFCVFIYLLFKGQAGGKVTSLIRCLRIQFEIVTFQYNSIVSAVFYMFWIASFGYAWLVYTGFVQPHPETTEDNGNVDK